MLLLARTTPKDQVQKRTDGLSVFIVDMREFRSALPSMLHQSGVEVGGIMVQEYTASYAQPLAEWFGPSLLDKVSIGASLKVMNAKTFFSPFALSSLGDFEGIAEELLTESREEP